MRIEKVNDSQIRCFLSKEDMESRQLHLKELAYGTEKARLLFRELMQEAYARFGFEAENIPVMVEAVPLHDDSLVLIVTKVDNPEELDTRFSSFAPSVRSGSSDKEESASALGQLLDAIRREIGDPKIRYRPEYRKSSARRCPAVYLYRSGRGGGCRFSGSPFLQRKELSVQGSRRFEILPVSDALRR